VKAKYITYYIKKYSKHNCVKFIQGQIEYIKEEYTSDHKKDYKDY